MWYTLPKACGKACGLKEKKAVAGNRRAFDKAMKKAASHAWNKAWPKAIKEYEQAVKEFPNDVTALLGLAIAHFEAGHLEAARKLFQQLYEAEPQDAVVLSPSRGHRRAHE